MPRGRHGIFRVNAKELETGDGLTAFNRVTERLGIDQICATTPQAKGRVERANKTLQDRLIKEMRLAGIRDIAAAQAFLPGFRARHNARFAVEPRNAEDAHAPWREGTDALDAALAAHEPRTPSKALTFSAGGAVHCIRTAGAGIALRGAKVVVRRYLDGRMDVVFKDRALPYTTVRRKMRLDTCHCLSLSQNNPARIDVPPSQLARHGTTTRRLSTDPVQSSRHFSHFTFGTTLSPNISIPSRKS
jgi:hypothetical protein